MTEKELEIVIAGHEMQRLELKEAFGAETVESACAFANAQGGYIVIGVDDKGRLAKFPLRSEALRDYENRIATATEPSVAVDAEKVPFRSGQVVVLKVSENPLKPVAQAFYDMHLIEHYSSGIRRIKDECAKNGNTPPTWSQNYGSFITVYKSRLESDPIKQDSGTTNEVVNGPHEVVNEVVSEADNKPDNKLDNNRTLDNIIVEVVRSSPGINRAGVAMSVGKGKSVVAETVARLKALGLIEYRGSKKTGGYYAVKQED